MKHLLGFFLLALILSSCAGYSDSELQEFDETIQEYLQSNSLKMEKDEEGLYFSVIDEGHGAEYIKYNDQVTFIYEGSFLNGDVFQIIDQDSPLSYTVNQLIYGWQNGLMKIKEGGKVLLIIPPQLGYGKKSTGVVPANTIIKFELSVLEVK